MTIVFLDSNIYRQCGQNFTSNQDFLRLKDFLDKTYNDLGLLSIVEREFLDFIEIDIYEKLKLEYSKIKSAFQNNSFLNKELLPDLEVEINNAFKAAKEQLTVHKLKIGNEAYETQELLNFLLSNKRINGRKDNTRDYMIASDIFNFCVANKADDIVLISDDDFFHSNKYIQELRLRLKVENLYVFKNIPEFLKDFGPQFEFVNDELVLSAIDEQEICNEILNDIKAFPGYVSDFYVEKSEKEIPEIETLAVKSIDVHDFYVTKKLKSEEFSIQFSLAVSIKATFKPEKNLEALEKYLKLSTNKIESFKPDSFDSENRIIFDHKILFIYQGIVNPKIERIQKVEFIDYFIDHFLWEEYKEKVLKERRSISPQFLCTNGENHIFDTDNGFYKPSQYGGGLSWHYRCKRCGQLYDTGEFFD